MKIYLDFDGTVVEHTYPTIGRCNFGCFEVIKKLQDAGHEIILNTMRVELNDGTFEKSLKHLSNGWMMIKDKSKRDSFEMKEITDYTKSKIHPHRWDLENSIKIGEMYIDDIATDIPLKDAVMTNGKMVDWDELDRQFIEYKIY